MPDVVIYGSTDRSPELRHEVPLLIGDPFLYIEKDGKQTVVIGAMEMPRIEAVAPHLELLPPEDFGSDELIAGGVASFHELGMEIYLRACKKLGIERAVVPHTFPLHLADKLRAAGIELEPDREFFDQRRNLSHRCEVPRGRRCAKSNPERPITLPPKR